jgi:phosphinothricin acetyltransferase
MSKLPIIIRSAEPSDMDTVSTIHKHYVLNTVATFLMEPLSVEDHIANLAKVQAQRLPYLVAVSQTDSKLVGYSYLSGFRGGKAGYKHTVELSLYCDPPYVGEGIGSALLTKVLEIMTQPEEFQHEFLRGQVRGEDCKVRHIMSVMAVDSEGREQGLGLKRYYEGFGFEMRGHMKEIGHKLGRW